MKTLRALSACALALVVAGCNKPASISGTYGNSDAAGAAELILTENQQQQILGSLSLAALENDGSMRRLEMSITGGAYDPKTGMLTITARANGLLAQQMNMTGQMTNGGMDLTIGGNVEHLTTYTTLAFNKAVAALTKRGQEQQNVRAAMQKTDADNKTAGQLLQDLTAYDNRVLGSTGSPANARVAEEKIIAAAQKDIRILEAMKAQGQGDSYPAGQVRFRVGQLDFQMGQIKFQVDGALQQGRDHIGGFDARLAKSPCNTTSGLSNCGALMQEQQRYATVRSRVLGNQEELASDIQKYGSQMEVLNHAAGN